MKIKVGISIIVLLMLLNGANGIAQGNGYYSQNHHQGKRIHQGWKQGDLDRMEMRQLVRQQRRINQVEREMMQDGRLSRRERKELARMRNAADRNIYMQRHDDDRKCKHRR